MSQITGVLQFIFEVPDHLKLTNQNTQIVVPSFDRIDLQHRYSSSDDAKSIAKAKFFVSDRIENCAVFVDVSGSMQEGGRIEQAKKILTAVTVLSPSIPIYPFDNIVHRSVKADEIKVRGGGTDYKEVINFIKINRVDAIIITDGNGQIDPIQLRDIETQITVIGV